MPSKTFRFRLNNLVTDYNKDYVLQNIVLGFNSMNPQVTDAGKGMFSLTVDMDELTPIQIKDKLISTGFVQAVSTGDSKREVRRLPKINDIRTSDKKFKEYPNLNRHAGLMVKAKDTGRILLIQTQVDKKSKNRGKWELPGGHEEVGEDLLETAIREWEEEVGCKLPKGKIKGQWNNGRYHVYLYVIKKESLVKLNITKKTEEFVNPDNPKRKPVDVVAWWDPEHIEKSTYLRTDLFNTNWRMVKKASRRCANEGCPDEQFKGTGARWNVHLPEGHPLKRYEGKTFCIPCAHMFYEHCPGVKEEGGEAWEPDEEHKMSSLRTPQQSDDPLADHKNNPNHESDMTGEPTEVSFTIGDHMGKKTNKDPITGLDVNFAGGEVVDDEMPESRELVKLLTDGAAFTGKMGSSWIIYADNDGDGSRTTVPEGIAPAFLGDTTLNQLDTSPKELTSDANIVTSWVIHSEIEGAMGNAGTAQIFDQGASQLADQDQGLSSLQQEQGTRSTGEGHKTTAEWNSFYTNDSLKGLTAGLGIGFFTDQDSDSNSGVLQSKGEQEAQRAKSSDGPSTGAANPMPGTGIPETRDGTSPLGGTAFGSVHFGIRETLDDYEDSYVDDYDDF